MTLSQADNDIRQRVALALGENPAVAPVSVPAVAEALRAEGATALAYLLPPHATRPGRALVVRPDGVAAAVDLDGLDMGAYAEIEAYQKRMRESSGPAGWIDSLDGLCAWAWRAVMRPLLDAVGGSDAGESVRLVLVPCGLLALVPWHAAADRSDTGGALDRAAISYAASAGQLVEAARRTRLPVRTAPVLLGNPTFDLLYTRWCVEGLAEEVYPGAVTYGSLEIPIRGTGTPEEVLSRLPGAPVDRIASVIHLGCHAALDPGTNPLRSALQLADGPLAVERILRHAAARPPGAVAGLVVLGACTSDATAAAYDESLTLTTSMLAAGAYGVVGARWQVRDARTAVLLYALHHHLAAGSRPAEALRTVQRWARDPGRKPLPGMPDNLVETLDRLDHDPGEPDFAHVYSWAAFAHHGC